LYRIIFIIITVLAIALGLLIGTLNSDTVNVDLLWVQLDWPLGLLILSSSAAGLVLGLVFSWLFSILPLRSQLRKARGRDAFNSSGPLSNNHD
jgi:uncharacterized integral membrane protein